MIEPDSIAPAVQALLEARALRVRDAVQEADEQSMLWAAEFRLADERCALPLASLRGAVPLRLVSGVPLAPAHVLGIFRFDGRVVVASSLAALLGVRGWQRDPTVLLVLEIEDGELRAIDCESIPKPIALPLGEVNAARGRNPHAASVEVVLEGRQLVRLLDPTALFARGAAAGVAGERAAETGAPGP